jgi:hypothetical protein
MPEGLTCMVTVHGIGFQQPPRNGQPGYADHLHERLKARLGAQLGDDPNRWDDDQQASLPVYVQSSWEGVRSEGLARLAPDKPLVRPVIDPPATIAHVALVYADLEEWGPRFSPALDTLVRSALNLPHYSNPFAVVHMLAADLMAMRHPRPGAPLPPSQPSLRPRRDIPGLAHRPENLLRRASESAAEHLAVVQALVNDVASYIYRNDLRERLRGFVQEALTRLAAREDVTTIVLNTHSQGTVLGFDVLTRYAPSEIRALVTAGSPLRKYVDLFSWGNRVGLIRDLVKPKRKPEWRWLNVYDERDPVADPLRWPVTWHVGDPAPGPDAPTLFQMYFPDRKLHDTDDCPVTDEVVHNVAHSRGGLPAHNYWDNNQEFIPKLAGLLTELSPVPAA